MARLLPALAMSLSLATPLHAEPNDRAVDFMAANVIATLLHEFGHAAIDQFALPVLGQEEDAADAFATLEILRGYDPDTAMDILVDVAEAGLVAHERGEPVGIAAYQGSHDLDAQRAYRAICHLYGTDPGRFEQAAAWARLEEARRESCEWEAELAWDSWDRLLAEVTQEGGAVARFPVTHQETDATATLLRDIRVVEETVEAMATAFDWPRPVPVIIARCDEANAWYDPASVEITFCLEFAEEYLEIGAGE